MTPEQQAAFIFSQAACAYAEIAAMAAENLALVHGNEPPRYRYDDFIRVPLALGICHNDVLGMFR